MSGASDGLLIQSQHEDTKALRKSIRILKEKNHVQQKISRILFIRMREIFIYVFFVSSCLCVELLK